jgi:hypothetical protein
MTPAKFLWIQKQDMGPKARGGHAAASRALQIFGWKKARAPELDGVAYLHDEESFTRISIPTREPGAGHAGCNLPRV